MQKLIEFNENQNTPLYRTSHLEDLKHKSEYFDRLLLWFTAVFSRRVL